MTSPLIGARVDSNLDVIRVVAALAVLVGHGVTLTAREEIPILGLSMSSLGVMVFFVISGWLIAGSWNRNPNPSVYFVNRALRIFPALIAVTVLTVFVLGPLVTSLSPGEYFTASGTWQYLGNAALWTQFGLPGVFESTPFPGVVNGSLWTLPVEFGCYVGIALLGVVPRRARIWWAAATAVLGIAAFALVSREHISFGAYTSETAMLVAFFAAGAFLRYLADRIGHRRWIRVDVAAGLLVLNILSGYFGPLQHSFVAWVLLPYITLAFGLASTPIIRRASRFGDFSYGLYLWAFPVQQVVVMLVPGIPFIINTAIVTLVTGVLAVASWWLIEKPALGFKLGGAVPPTVVPVEHEHHPAAPIPAAQP